ncbi:hypothetical protein [Streptomyces sp. MZ04]|uniref:hypothetical protein n=1 Tax=Streptomyces sp. MZ04 TaxID=2559236 RepID=UPI00107EB6F4|nr:hypothetical protein [Streptomyces sp. MZ04]TGB10663.1 hypothetical protein E2651_14200 [Streptomyces sp. MZ04]
MHARRPIPPALTRRGVLGGVGGLGLGGLLSACGGDSGDGDDAKASGDGDDSKASGDDWTFKDDRGTTAARPRRPAGPRAASSPTSARPPRVTPTLWYVPEESAKKITSLAPTVGILTGKTSLTKAIGRCAALTDSLGADLRKSKPTWAKLPAVKADQVVSWSNEAQFSHAGYAPLIEHLAAAVDKSKKAVC